ncbi:hypothetical protein QCA50_014751 [Cerrena zonata]|uniref:HAMP domain-containing protein n=1 Tax=Cerrena zonata TaxID=2478898 RepID=A0AAW0FV62_9APHY
MSATTTPLELEATYLHTCPHCGHGLTFDSSTSTITETTTVESPPLPLIIPPGPLTNLAHESGMNAAEELKLLKQQVSDIARVCNAVSRGDLSRRITVPVQGAVMVQLKDVVNEMVDKLGQFAQGMTRVLQDPDIRSTPSGQSEAPDIEGTWFDLTSSICDLVSNQTNQIRAITEVTKAVTLGDLSKQVDVEARGEMLELKATVNHMISSLRAVIEEVSRVALDIQQGVMGSQIFLPDVQGSWKALTDNLNVMADRVTMHVRWNASVYRVVAHGDLTWRIGSSAYGEMSEVKEIIHDILQTISAVAYEIARVTHEVGTDGKLGQRVQLDHLDLEGAWKNLVHDVNNMTANLASQVRTIAIAIKTIEHGDYTQKIVPDIFHGEMLALVNSINRIMDTCLHSKRK